MWHADVLTYKVRLMGVVASDMYRMQVMKEITFFPFFSLSVLTLSRFVNGDFKDFLLDRAAGISWCTLWF